MPGENLTREEARIRAQHILVDSYEVTLDLTTGPTTFGSHTRITFNADPGSGTFLDLIADTVHTVLLNGTVLEPKDVFADSRIRLANLQATNTVEILADCAYTNTGEGLHRFVDPVDDQVYLYSQFEVPDSRRVFAVFEQPDIKATFQFTVTAPSEWKVFSNSPTPQPEPQLDDGESSTWRFAPTARISSYITAIVAGPYQGITDQLTTSDGRTIPLGLYCRGSLLEHLDSDEILDVTKRGFAFFEEKFDTPYPFEKYDQIFVPEFNAGAMENAGCVTYTETYVFRSKVTEAIRERRVVTILHELAHMWFGNLVTMRWWNDLWLNESFAEWASTIATAEATRWEDAWTTFAAMEKSWAYKQDQLPSTHPVAADIRDLDDVLVNFDGITYAKGGSVLKQLVAWVGREAFFTGVSQYFAKHRWGNTELKDLLTELEAASGRDLSQWTQLWLESSGVNTLRPVISTDDAGVFSAVYIDQTAVADYPLIRPHRLGIGLYNKSEHGALVRSQRFEIDVAGERTAVPELIGLAQPDLLLINDDDLAYAKIRLDAQSWTVALDSLSQITDSLARALVWGAAWDATRDGEIPARDYLALVRQHIGAEDQSTTLRTTLAQAVLAARTYVAPQHQAEQIAALAQTLMDLLEQAPAGSDQQLQFVKYFAQVASTGAQVEYLAALRSGAVTLPGLVIDTDLGWELLDGLLLNGHANPEEIDALLSADDTASGQQAAARARAAQGTPEAKLAAFDYLTKSADVPNAIVRATTVGFGNVNDAGLLQGSGLIDAYYGAISELWQSRSHAIAEAIVTGLYPAGAANAELLAAGETWLAQHTAQPDALRRLVVENVAGTRRALEAQRADLRG